MLIIKSKVRGFSLIELMVAVALFGILATLGASSYRIWIENSRIRNAAQSIQTGLQKARMEAIKRNARIQFQLGQNSGWNIGCVNVTAQCPAVIEVRPSSEGSSANIQVVTAPDGANAVVFTALGQVSAVPAPFTQIDLDTTAINEADSRELRVLINAGGSVRMCDPYPGLSPSDPRRC